MCNTFIKTTPQICRMMNTSLVKNQPSYHIFNIQSNTTKNSSLFSHKPTFSIPYFPRNLTTTSERVEYHIHAVKKQQLPSSSSAADEEEAAVKEEVKNEDDMGRSLVMTGAASVGFMLIMMGLGHEKALALGPEGPLMEEFWENVRRYGLYALTVSTGVLYSVFQPIYELLKNPISAILVLIILGGTFYIGSQVLSAMVGLSDFDYQYAY